jgi:hypothetical protein
MNPDRLIGLAFVCERWHSGRESRGYRMMCRIRWEPGTERASNLLPRDEWAEARRWAAHYTWLARSGRMSL